MKKKQKKKNPEEKKDTSSNSLSDLQKKKDYSRKNQNNCWEALNNKYDCIACNEIRIINTKHDQGRTFTNNICV